LLEAMPTIGYGTIKVEAIAYSILQSRILYSNF